jgi:hypothetical protein
MDCAFTGEELNEFRSLVDSVSGRDQMTRISARLDMHRFIRDHGKEKCDAMWQIIKDDEQ